MEQSYIIKKFKDLGFSEYDIEDLTLFLNAKDLFLSERTNENSGLMKAKYMNIYMAVKHLFVAHKISAKTFEDLIELLQEGL